MRRVFGGYLFHCGFRYMYTLPAWYVDEYVWCIRMYSVFCGFILSGFRKYFAAL